MLRRNGEHTMADADSKAEIIREFSRLRAAGQPVPPSLYTRFVAVTNEDYATGPAVGERVPEFALSDQYGRQRTLHDLAGPSGTLLVFFRSADW
jgi:hypothetical protein